jgi:hypothetical protein
MEDREVKETLQKYDWDGSGDIDFSEFEGLVQDGLLMEGKLEEYQRAWQARPLPCPHLTPFCKSVSIKARPAT